MLSAQATLILSVSINTFPKRTSAFDRFASVKDMMDTHVEAHLTWKLRDSYLTSNLTG
jgi:hypothetical protein